MPKFIQAWLLPLLLISSNGFLGWLINQLPSKPDNIPSSLVIWLTVGCIALQLILTVLSSNPQQPNPTSVNQNWMGGFLPLIGGVILAIPLYLKLVPTDINTIFSYIATLLFGLGAILPPVMILPKKWQKLLIWMVPGIGVFVTVHFIIIQQSTAAILSLVLTFTATIFIVTQDFFKLLISEISTIWQEWQRRGAVSVAAWFKTEIEDLWSELTSPFKREYYQSLIYKCRDYETQGLDKDRILQLEKVFVPLKISTNEAANVSQAMIPRQERQGKAHEIWNFLGKSPRMVILGAPGSGKTTLLRHLTLIYATKNHKVYPQAPKLIPVLIYLREVRQEIINNNNKPSLPDLITQQVRHLNKRKPLNPPPKWFVDKLEKNKCLVMLDGLDEVADEEERRQVSTWLEDEMGKYPDTIFILTSRPNGYKSARIKTQAIDTLEVQPFSREQIKEFLENWYLQTEVRSRAGQEDEGVREEAQKEANNLIQRIQNSRPLLAMAVNPLLLTMIATVHRRGNVLPGKRVELYKEICQILLERRQRAKDIPSIITASQKQSVLQVLALELMEKNTRDFNLLQVEKLLQTQLATFPNNLANAPDFINHIRDDCGLLVEKEIGIYEFAHLSFQEYLAAVQIEKNQNEQLLISHINNSWWAETIRLYAAQINNASNLIRAVIDMPSPSLNALVLISDYEEEGWRVDPTLRQQLTDKLDLALESNDPEIFKLAAEVKLTRRLRNLVPINEKSAFDMIYISNAEYQLFINETGATKPPTWQTNKFAAGDANENIAGVNWSDANRFCLWLQKKETQNQSNIVCYRLLTEAERTTYPAKNLQDDKLFGESGIRLFKFQLPSLYSQLAYYLMNGEWEEADVETALIMLQVMKDRGIRFSEFPCSDLRIIDQLWVYASKGKWGFCVQKSINQKYNGDWDRYKEELQRLYFTVYPKWIYSIYSDVNLNLFIRKVKKNTMNEDLRDFCFQLIKTDEDGEELAKRLIDCNI